jgi:hypothetical protein
MNAGERQSLSLPLFHMQGLNGRAAKKGGGVLVLHAFLFSALLPASMALCHDVTKKRNLQPKRLPAAPML